MPKFYAEKAYFDLGKIVVELEEEFCQKHAGNLYKSFLKEIEKPLIEAVLEKTFGNQIRAAKILGLNRNTIRSKIRKLGIDPKVYR